MSELKVSGKITHIGEVVTGESANGEWAKVEFVVETTDGQYSSLVAFTIFGAEKVDNFLKYNKVGNQVDVSFNPRSREYNGKYYTDLLAWKVWGEKPAGGAKPAPAPAAPNLGEDDDDLPF